MESGSLHVLLTVIAIFFISPAGIVIFTVFAIRFLDKRGVTFDLEKYERYRQERDCKRCGNLDTKEIFLVTNEKFSQELVPTDVTSRSSINAQMGGYILWASPEGYSYIECPKCGSRREFKYLSRDNSGYYPVARYKKDFSETPFKDINGSHPVSIPKSMDITKKRSSFKKSNLRFLMICLSLILGLFLSIIIVSFISHLPI